MLRESAPQLAIGGLVILGILLLLGAAGTAIGVIALVLVAILVLAELRHVHLAHKSTARIEEALEGIEGPEDGPRVPRSPPRHPAARLRHPRASSAPAGSSTREADGMSLRLDVYRPADDDPHDDLLHPAVIQVHGGGWLAGSRYEQGIPLLNHLASIGWVGFNIDYRLSPQATFPDHIVDVKRAIAWVRENAGELGIDPEMICITGGSAGGHLTALAGLTINDPGYQPGFEEADTTVAAAVPFYGVYDLTNAGGHYYPRDARVGLREDRLQAPVRRGRASSTATPRRSSGSAPTRRRSSSSTATATPWSRSGTRATSSSGSATSPRSGSPTSSWPAPSTPSTSGRRSGPRGSRRASGAS